MLRYPLGADISSETNKVNERAGCDHKHLPGCITIFRLELSETSETKHERRDSPSLCNYSNRPILFIAGLRVVLCHQAASVA